ncbi:hypothetical protein GCM10020219_065530 [Nonomuraea dietziae]
MDLATPGTSASTSAPGIDLAHARVELGRALRLLGCQLDRADQQLGVLAHLLGMGEEVVEAWPRRRARW